MRILLILVPFAFAISGLVFLQTGMFVPNATPLLDARVVVPVLEITSVTDVVARLPSEDQIATTTNENPEMMSLTSSVLTGLGVTSSTSTAPVDSEMRNLTSSVLAGLTGTMIVELPVEEMGLEQLVAMAMEKGETDAYIDMLVNTASDQGLVVIPPALRTSDGRVDTRIFLSEIERTSSGQAATVPSDEVIAGGPGVEVRIVQEAGETVAHHFYTVQSGDSLGAIAHTFYGDAGLFTGIFEANRRLLSSPDRIKAGQRLTIPKLPRT